MLNQGVKKFEFLVDIVRQPLTIAAMLSMEVQLSDDALEILDALSKRVEIPREELVSQVLEEMLPLLLRGKHSENPGYAPKVRGEDSEVPSSTGHLGGGNIVATSNPRSE